MDGQHGTAPVVRVEWGHAEDDELAAVTVVLMYLLARSAEGDDAAPRRSPWRRWDSVTPYRAPHSWQ